MCTTLFFHSSVDGRLVSFHVQATGRGTAQNMRVQGTLWKPMDGLDRTSILTIFSVFICEQSIAALPSILLECLCVCAHA